MNQIIQKKWFIFIAWIVLAAGLFSVAPDMANLVREKGQITIPDEYSSSLAGNIMSETKAQEGEGNTSSAALVFYNEDKLTDSEITEAEKGIQLLEENKASLGITEVLSHFNEESLKDQLVSEDGKAILAQVSFSWNGREPSEVNDALYDVLKDVDVDYYYTSEWMINEDLVKSSEEGLKKTEGITVVFILGVLLLVFRSVVAPIIPLLAVGFTYLTSQSIVAILVEQFNFPLSNYTQIFLVAILFGIGTDYCILLLSRYKEELGHSESITEAIFATYKNAGRTVLFSGIAVMIGFAAIGFSQFILYQSAAAVAIGVAVLMIALFTLVPFFMAVFGRKLFWPSKGSAEHGESKLWLIVGKFSLARPFAALLIVAIICVPFLVTYDGKLSFNSLEEVSGDVHSVKAFNAIADSFGPGESMPTQIVLKNDEEMDSTEYLAIAEEISKAVEKVAMVDKVRSITRPAGEPIEDFLISKQAGQLGAGLGEGKDGIDQIKDGLNEASTALAQSEPELAKTTDGIGELITGTNQVKAGLGEIQTNLSIIEKGIRDASMGSDQMKAGLAEAKAGTEELLAGYEALLAGYQTVQTNLDGLSGGYAQIGAGLAPLAEGLGKAQTGLFAYVEGKHTDLTDDPQYANLKGTIIDLQGNLAGLSGQFNELNSGLASLSAGMKEANGNFEKAIAGQKATAAGLQQLIDGISAQQAGLTQLADGQGQIVANMPQLENGLTGISGGQEQLLAGFGGLGSQLGELTDGLQQSVDGLGQVSDGLGTAKDYLSDLSADSDAFYLPAEALESEEFAQALDMYLSLDRKVMTIDVIFGENPYSNEAIHQVGEIKDRVEQATKGTKLENAVIAVGGPTSMNADLETISAQDYTRTVVLMLAGISIILVFLFRSIIMPAYIIASLILTYYTSMAINEVIFVNLLGYTGISWAVPFFAFVILVALGVDYSIFLMDRFNEYKDLSVADAMLTSMKKMGTVIISAAIILGGTFAAMMPSGMLSLLQIAAIVIVGLFLYALVMLPLFIPVMVKNFGAANWWPFKR